MRALLAIDGSISSDHARDLAASLAWPEGSTIRVVGVLERASDQFWYPFLPAVPENADAVESDVVGRLRIAIETAEASLAGSRSDLAVDHVLLHGHAARAIVDEAREFGAELVVLGSRGHGPFQTALLGSTSAEVVDHAPCPVLVARRSRLASMVLADDGSSGAQDAASIVAAWPILSDRAVTVVSVAEAATPWAVSAPGRYDHMESYAGSVGEGRRQHEDLAGRRADQLAARGRRADSEVRAGDPAAQIVAAAAEHGVDLVVVGTRGRTGLTRMILGSVARKVLTHAPCSVLVVRQGVVRLASDEAAEPDTVPVGAGRA